MSFGKITSKIADQYGRRASLGLMLPFECLGNGYG